MFIDNSAIDPYPWNTIECGIVNIKGSEVNPPICLRRRHGRSYPDFVSGCAVRGGWSVRKYPFTLGNVDACDRMVVKRTVQSFPFHGNNLRGRRVLVIWIRFSGIDLVIAVAVFGKVGNFIRISIDRLPGGKRNIMETDVHLAGAFLGLASRLLNNG